jgi:hypothetical protein
LIDALNDLISSVYSLPGVHDGFSFEYLISSSIYFCTMINFLFRGSAYYSPESKSQDKGNFLPTFYTLIRHKENNKEEKKEDCLLYILGIQSIATYPAIPPPLRGTPPHLDQSSEMAGDLAAGADHSASGGKGSRSSTRHRQFRDRAKTRVDDLQEMFSGLQSARKESRSADAAVLEEQVHQMLREWRAELSVSSPASSLQACSPNPSPPPASPFRAGSPFYCDVVSSLSDLCCATELAGEQHERTVSSVGNAAAAAAGGG